jgi:hypothetical protein
MGKYSRYLGALVTGVLVTVHANTNLPDNSKRLSSLRPPLGISCAATTSGTPSPTMSVCRKEELRSHQGDRARKRAVAVKS